MPAGAMGITIYLKRSG
jgi:hypothetical protein